MCGSIGKFISDLIKSIGPLICVGCLLFAGYVAIFAEAGALTVAEAGLTYLPEFIAGTAAGGLSPAMFAACVVGVGVLASPSTAGSVVAGAVNTVASAAKPVVSALGNAFGSLVSNFASSSGLTTLLWAAGLGFGAYTLIGAIGSDEEPMTLREEVQRHGDSLVVAGPPPTNFAPVDGEEVVDDDAITFDQPEPDSGGLEPKGS